MQHDWVVKIGNAAEALRRQFVVYTIKVAAFSLSHKIPQLKNSPSDVSFLCVSKQHGFVVQ